VTAWGLPQHHALVALTLSLCLLPEAAQALTQDQPVTQLAARNREASIYTFFKCDSRGENQRTYILYQYTNRLPGSPLYRLVIYPSYYVVGHHDWPDRNILIDFIARGCHSIVGDQPR
jgi:hypothetical protein